jgi:hypothetical protein
VELAQARTRHDEALGSSQQRYRAAVDEALLAERHDARAGERAYLDAVSHAAAASRAAKTFADQALAEALAKIPEAREVLRSWRAQLATIAMETKEAEQAAFARFRRDLEALKT